MTIKQPLTGKQIGRRTGIPMDTCSYVVAKLVTRGLLTCLNPEARNSRLYWLTEIGIQCRKKLHRDSGLPYKEYDLPGIDWSLYGWMCFSHRSIVMKTLTVPMQPGQIYQTMRKNHTIGKRISDGDKKSEIRISANNIRDVVKLLLEKGIVQKVFVIKKARPLYELTDSGNQLRDILMQSEMSF